MSGGQTNLEPFEDDCHVVIQIEPFALSLSSEVASVSLQAPIAGPITFAFIPGEAGIDRTQGADSDLRRAPDTPRHPLAIDDHDLGANMRERGFPTLEITSKARGRSFHAADDEFS